MESSGKNVVYVRRGDGDKKSDWKQDGKEVRRDDGKGKHRFEGKMIRKRGLKDVTDKQDASKLDRTNSDRMEASPLREGGKVLGKYKSMERKFKEFSDGEERRGKVFSSKRDKDRDGTLNGYERRREIVGRGKRSVRHFKGTKVPNRTLSSKLKVRVGGVGSSLHSESLGKAKQGLGSSGADGENTENRAKKSAEPVKKRRHRLILQDNSDDDDYYPRPTVIKKDINIPRSPNADTEEGKEIDDDLSVPMAGHFSVSGGNSQGVRKSSRVPKKKVLEDFEDDVPDVGMTENSGEPKSFADDKVERDDTDTSDEKETAGSFGDASESDPELQDLDATLSKQPKSNDASSAKPRNAPLTARQRTMQLGKEGDANLGLNLIEFPTGLTQLTRRGTQKLSVEERLVKKAEAANRRKQVVERAAHEMQASAIQKILGQDSSRKRKEERLQKQREEIELEKKAAARELPSNSVRWTNGPQGITVSWSADVDLPSIFSSCPSGYPPPKQKCAAPFCTNTYNYRDSKSNMPLCSLRCYDAMRPPSTLVTS